LYRHGELDQPIPVDLYLVVAQVLAYVYQLKHRPDQMPLRPAFDVPAAYVISPEGTSGHGSEGMRTTEREPNRAGVE
jgi:hypothetical protein